MAFKIIAAMASNKPTTMVAIANNAIVTLNPLSVTYRLNSHAVKKDPNISNATLGTPRYRSGLLSVITVRMLIRISTA